MGEPPKGILEGILEPPEEESAESWFEKYLEPCLDRFLKVLEFLTVAIIAIAVIAAVIYETLWVLCGDLPADRQTRMQNALTLLNGNWKASLLLLVPLFYRALRAFLQRVDEVFGIKASRAPDAISTGTMRKRATKENSPREES